MEAAGAEHLVIGELLIRRIQAFRAHANQPGYDLLAIDPVGGRSLRIQVKSRVAVDSGSFRLESLDFDFVVFVRLNRGTKASLRVGQPQGGRAPEFYILWREEVRRLCGDAPMRVPRRLVVQNRYLNDWSLLEQAVRLPVQRLPNSFEGISVLDGRITDEWLLDDDDKLAGSSDPAS